jgi:hypothetical protein
MYITNCAVKNKNKSVKNKIKLKYPLLSQRMRGRLRAWARGTIVALLLRWPIPLILVRAIVPSFILSLPLSSLVLPALILVFWSSSSAPRRRVVLVVVIPTSLPLFHHGPLPWPCCRCLVLVLVVLPSSSSALLLLCCRSTLRAGARSGVWRVLGRLHRQQF